MNVSQIREQINQIRFNLQRLISKELPEISQFESRANEIVSNRHESIQEYKKCEIAAAHKLYDGMIYGIESEYENGLNKIHDHIQQFILFKKNQLCEDFPEAAEYFETQSENNKFLQLINSLSHDNEIQGDNSKDVEVSLNQGCLIPKRDIDQRYDELQNNEIYKINQGILFKDDVPFLSVGDNVALHLNESLAYNGTIRQIQSFIEIDISGTIIKISVSALNIGIATLNPI